MNVANKGIKKIFLATIFLYFSLGNSLSQDFSKLAEKSVLGLKKQIDTQKIYEEMPENIPSVCLLAFDGVGGINNDLLEKVAAELKKQMVLTSAFKPISMTKWLDGEFSGEKSSSIFQFFSVLRNKRYPINLRLVLKPELIRIGSKYLVLLTLYNFENENYPLKALRITDSEKELPKAIENCLLDLKKLNEIKKDRKKRIAILPFEINCRTLAEQKNGDFDFIKTSFSEQEGVELKEEDDFFSDIFSYQTECTGLFNSISMSNIKEYTKAPSAVGIENADFFVKGKIQLTDRINLIDLRLVNCETGKSAGGYKYFTEKLDIDTIWKFNNHFLSEICKTVFGEDEYVSIEKIEEPNRAFYINGMFIGRDRLANIPIPKKNLKIKTGTYMEADKDDEKSLFIYMEQNRIEIFKGRNGEFVWNLLEK
nr:hypothetical protein [Treponema sp.]